MTTSPDRNDKLSDVSIDGDSRARTHLANERTFLAWFRTGLALIALGLAAGQFLSNSVADWLVLGLSITMIATGAVLVVVGLNRYRRNRQAIDQAQFQPATTSVDMATAAAVVAAVLAVVFVWVVRA